MKLGNIWQTDKQEGNFWGGSGEHRQDQSPSAGGLEEGRNVQSSQVDRWKDPRVVETGNLNSGDPSMKKSKAVWSMAPRIMYRKNWASQTRYSLKGQEGPATVTEVVEDQDGPVQLQTQGSTIEPPLYRATICSHVTFKRSLPRMTGHIYPRGKGFCG